MVPSAQGWRWYSQFRDGDGTLRTGDGDGPSAQGMETVLSAQEQATYRVTVGFVMHFLQSRGENSDMYEKPV